MSRSSNHVEPRGAMATVRHYLRDLVYGANDGIITTFAVVAGVAGGSLSPTAVLIIGTANLAADGLSMAVGNFLAIRANERARAVDDLPEEEAHPEKHAAATMMAFHRGLRLGPVHPADRGGDVSEDCRWRGRRA